MSKKVILKNNPPRLAVLVSGGGTTLDNFVQKIAAGQLNAQIACVIASNTHAYEAAQHRLHVKDRQLKSTGRQAASGTLENIKGQTMRMTDQMLVPPIFLITRSDYKSAADFSIAIFEQIRSADTDLVCLGGFLSLLEIPDDFKHRVINIHPALLPAFGGQGMFGKHVHSAVLAAGCKVSGCTVHFADQTYDTGQIIVQRCCVVHENDSPGDLAARVFEQECIAYPQAINLLAAGKVSIDGRRAVIEK